MKKRLTPGAFGPKPPGKIKGKLARQIENLARDTVAKGGLGGTPTPRKAAKKRSKKSKSR
jgi:hypothetical protein